MPLPHHAKAGLAPAGLHADSEDRRTGNPTAGRQAVLAKTGDPPAGTALSYRSEGICISWRPAREMGPMGQTASFAPATSQIRGRGRPLQPQAWRLVPLPHCGTGVPAVVPRPAEVARNWDWSIRCVAKVETNMRRMMPNEKSTRCGPVSFLWRESTRRSNAEPVSPRCSPAKRRSYDWPAPCWPRSTRNGKAPKCI